MSPGAFIRHFGPFGKVWELASIARVLASIASISRELIAIMMLSIASSAWEPASIAIILLVFGH